LFPGLFHFCSSFSSSFPFVFTHLYPFLFSSVLHLFLHPFLFLHFHLFPLVLSSEPLLRWLSSSLWGQSPVPLLLTTSWAGTLSQPVGPDFLSRPELCSPYLGPHLCCSSSVALVPQFVPPLVVLEPRFRFLIWYPVFELETAVPSFVPLCCSELRFPGSSFRTLFERFGSSFGITSCCSRVAVLVPHWFHLFSCCNLRSCSSRCTRSCSSILLIGWTQLMV
jgi:hypothetical protein